MNTITDACNCDLDFNCGQHEAEDARTWGRMLGLTPLPYDASAAFDVGDYRGRFHEGWDVS